MKKLSELDDKRINCKNYLIECTIKEYLSFAPNVIKNNEFQTKPVKTSKAVYSLLKDDLKQGCVIPPIVLAISDIDVSPDEDDLLQQIKNNTRKVMILDGLQRTYTLIEADDEMKSNQDYKQFQEQKLRLEVYAGINKFGILYRMLTLNTGQTPMSIRHQLEMMYSDKLGVDIKGVKVVKDTEGTANPDENEFAFKNTIEGFNSYLNRKEFPIDREELLDNIKILEKMSDESTDDDLYQDYLSCYVHVFNVLKRVTGDYEVSPEDASLYDISGNPFGKKASKVFSTSQAMTGFGAAIGRLRDSGLCSGFNSIMLKADKLEENDDNKTADWLLLLLKKMDIIRNTSKKIGNAQRMVFQYFFRELFNPESDSYLDLKLAVENGYQKYQSQVE